MLGFWSVCWMLFYRAVTNHFTQQRRYNVANVRLSYRSSERRMVYFPTFNDRATGPCRRLLHVRSSHSGWLQPLYYCICIVDLRVWRMKNVFSVEFSKFILTHLRGGGGRKVLQSVSAYPCVSMFTYLSQEAQLSQMKCAVCAVSWNLVECCTVVQKNPFRKACDRWMTLKVAQGHWNCC